MTNASKSRVSRRVLNVALWFCLLPGAVRGQESAPQTERRSLPEYEVKAAFLLNFVKFVAWPPLAERAEAPAFDICILGDNPFGHALDRITEGETVDNRPIAVKHIRKFTAGCEVLFIAASERDIAGILNQTGPGVLTIGESPSFLREGGIINFVVEDRRVRFDVNRKAAERASLEISSHLLSVARAVAK